MKPKKKAKRKVEAVRAWGLERCTNGKLFNETFEHPRGSGYGHRVVRVRIIREADYQHLLKRATK
jgi:hypothetical protein